MCDVNDARSQVPPVRQTADVLDFDQPSFRDPEHQQRYARDGYLVPEGVRLPEDALAALEKFYLDNRHHYADLRYTSTLALVGAHEHRASADQVFRKATSACVRELLDGYRQYYGGLGVKAPTGETAVLELHQDLTMVPYGEGRCGVTLWVPLCDVSEDNGCLQVVPGSHLVNRRPRGPGMPFAYRTEADLVVRQLVSLPVRRGQVVFMDQALIHRSGPNHTPDVRVAAMGMFRPSEASLVYYHLVRGEDGPLLHRYTVPEDFYLHHSLGSRPETGEYVGQSRPVVVRHSWS